MKYLTLFLVYVYLTHMVSAVEVVYGFEDPRRNKIKNWDLEDAIGSDDWVMKWASSSVVTEAHTGNTSLRIYNRSSKFGAAYQTIDGGLAGIKSNTNYYPSLFVRLLNGPSGADPYINLELFVTIALYNGERVVKKCGRMNYWLPSPHWQQLGADFKTPPEGVRSMELYLRVEPPEVDYLLDTVSLIELTREPNWKALLNHQIDRHRKNDVFVTGTFSNQIDISRTYVIIELINHEFGFGTAIKANHFNRPAEARYREVILNNFNMVVFENAMKWTPMEKRKGRIKFERVDQAMEVLLARNISVRGHALLWNVKATNPSWVQPLEGNELEAEVNRRVRYMMEHYKGNVTEWDVCNEHLQQRFIEDATGIPDMLEREFRLAHSIDPGAKLCLNDYLIARANGWKASAQANLARNLLADGVPCHCVGIQSHLRSLPIDPESLQKRIQIAATAGLPISITEFSVHSSSKSLRAAELDSAFRVYFANPLVTSITLWGFADQYGPFSDNYHLTEGVEFAPNHAGNAWVNLVKKEWHTRRIIWPSNRRVIERFRGFRGAYTLKVISRGVTLHERMFYVGKGTNRVHFAV